MPLPALAPIRCPRLTVRPVAAADLPDLPAVNGDDEVTRFLPYATWRGLDDARAWLARMEALPAAKGAQQLVIARRADGRVLGTVLLFKHDEASARVEIGCVVGRPHGRSASSTRGGCGSAGWARAGLTIGTSTVARPASGRRLTDGADAMNAPRLLGVDHVHVFVEDRAAAEAWYARVLGLARSPGLAFWASGGGPLTLQDRDDTVHLALFERPRQPNRATLALRVDAEAFAAWRAHLAAVPALAVTVEDHEIALSLYFSDPDGNPYEITTYEHAAARAALGRA